jgi:hypothetical protein
VVCLVAPPSEVGSPSEMVCPPSEMVWLLESVVGLEDVWGLLKVLGLGAWRVQKCWLVVEGPGPVWIRVGRMVLRVLDAEGHGLNPVLQRWRHWRRTFLA